MQVGGEQACSKDVLIEINGLVVAAAAEEVAAVEEERCIG